MVINNDGNITLYQNLGFHLFLYNKGDNLRLLCPNCHSQTPTYKGGNKKTPKNDARSIQHRDIYHRRKSGWL